MATGALAHAQSQPHDFKARKLRLAREVALLMDCDAGGVAVPTARGAIEARKRESAGDENAAALAFRLRVVVGCAFAGFNVGADVSFHAFSMGIEIREFTRRGC